MEQVAVTFTKDEWEQIQRSLRIRAMETVLLSNATLLVQLASKIQKETQHARHA